MGIDYVVDLGCTPKRELSTRELVSLIKSHGQAETVLSLARERGHTPSPADLRFSVVVTKPTGTETREVTAQELLDSAGPLHDLAHHCAGCPANLEDPAFPSGFGCYGHIPYPLSEETEAWLMALLPARLDCTAGEFLVRAVRDFGWDGSYAANLRGQGDVFFEGQEPCRRDWGGELAMSSDQLFDMLFGVGDLQPAHAAMLTLFLGLVPHDIDVDSLSAAFGEPARLRALFHACPIPAEPESGTGGVHRFLGALRMAAALDVPLAIDG